MEKKWQQRASRPARARDWLLGAISDPLSSIPEAGAGAPLHAPPRPAPGALGVDVRPFLDLEVLYRGTSTLEELPAFEERAELPARPEALASTTAICCSGGGIRSAAFNLGALEALNETPDGTPGVYQRASFVSAVSGGGYVAAAFACVRAAVTTEPQNGPTEVIVPGSGDPKPFAPLSPEEQYLHRHSRYLSPSAGVMLQAALEVACGLVANLAMLLVWLFIGARALGWALNGAGILPELGAGDTALGWSWTWWATGPLAAGLGLAVAVVQRATRPYLAPARVWINAFRGWTNRLLAAGAVLTILMVAAPLAVSGLAHLALTDQPNAAVARLLTAGGFATTSGCQAVAGVEPKVGAPPAARRACGRRPATLAGHTAGAPVSATPGTATATGVGVLGALLALIGGAAKLARDAGVDKPAKNWATKLLAQFGRQLIPWAGTALLCAVLAGAALRWLHDAVITGWGGHEAILVAAALGVFLVLKTFSDINRTSLHSFYRERLATEFILHRIRKGTSEDAEAVPYDIPISLSLLRATSHGDLPPLRSGTAVALGMPDGGPELILCAAANVDDDTVPTGRNAVPFTFTSRDVGVSLANRVVDGLGGDPFRMPVLEYELHAGKGVVTVPAAMAVSGAALSPLMGKMTRPSIRLLLAIGNLRLGLWLPNPYQLVPNPSEPKGFPGRVRRQWRQPGVRLLLAEAAGRSSLRSKWLYVTDGGHYDNLGLVEALKRRPDRLFVLDGTGDKDGSWTTLSQAIALADSDLGVRVDMTPPELTAPADDSGGPRWPCAVGRAWYPENGSIEQRQPDGGLQSRKPDAVIFYGKLGVAPETPLAVRSYQASHPQFPHDPTVDQLYGYEQLEAYRELGRWVGELLRSLSDV